MEIVKILLKIQLWSELPPIKEVWALKEVWLNPYSFRCIDFAPTV